MDLISKAMHFAIDAHCGERRKGDGEPMAMHAMEAAAIVARLTGDEETIAAAALHDVVEDSGVLIEEIEARFGPRVARLVASETEDKRRDMPPDQSWKLRKEEAVALLKNTDDMAVKMVFLGDKLSNMRSFYSLKQRLGKAMWEQFNEKDPQAHHWYYRTIADALTGLKDTLAWQEYDGLIAAVFDETKHTGGEAQ